MREIDLHGVDYSLLGTFQDRLAATTIEEIGQTGTSAMHGGSLRDFVQNSLTASDGQKLSSEQHERRHRADLALENLFGAHAMDVLKAYSDAEPLRSPSPGNPQKPA